MALTIEKAKVLADMVVNDGLSPAQLSRIASFDRGDKDQLFYQVIETATDEYLSENCVPAGGLVEAAAAHSSELKDAYLKCHRGYVGRKIREIRESKKLTQAELAKKAGIFQPYISRIENGEFPNSYLTIAKIAMALDVPIYKIDNNFDDVGSRVRATREHFKKSPEDLANLINRSVDEVKRIENSEYLSCVVVAEIADALGVRPVQIDPTYDLRIKQGKD